MAETRTPSIPSVPAAQDASIRQFLGAIKETIEVREGRRGDPLDMAVTLRRLKSMGALTLDQFGNPIFTGGGNVTVTAPGGGGGSGGYTPDLTPPPMPSGLTATAGFASIFIEWNSPAYTQGHGNAYTEIWAANRPAGGPDPTFGSAVFVGSTAGTGGFFSDSVPTLGVQRHYWIRHVTNDGVAGSYAGGTNGASAATGKVGGVDLAPLIIDASKLADGAVDIGGAKVTGTITDPARFGAAVIGSAAIQNLAVQNQHVFNISADKITFGYMSGDRISVNTLTADKFVVNLFQSDNVLTRNLTVRDASGNIILGAGYSLNWSNIAGQPAGIYNSNIYLNNGAIQGIGAGAGTVIDNAAIVIGGTNLVADFDSWALQSSDSLGVAAPDQYRISGFYLSAGYPPVGASVSPQISLKPNTVYTVSIKGRSATAGATFWIDLFPDTLPQQQFAVADNSSTWRGVWTFTTPNLPSDLANCTVRIFNASAQMYLWDLMLEEGNKATQWSPQPSKTLNSNITIGSNGALVGGGGGQVTISGLGYVGDLNATYGATIGSNLYGQITAANVSTYIASAAINLAQINVASIATLAALSATMGAVSIDGSGSSWHYIRTGSKWWNDGANGFIVAKAGTGETFAEFKAGNNRIWLSSWDDSGIAFVGSANFSVKSATSGARTEMGNRAIKIFDSAGTLRVRIGDLSA